MTLAACPILLARLARGVRRFMFTLLSTFMFTPLGPEFSCCYRPLARSNTPHFSLILTGALEWSTALRGSSDRQIATVVRPRRTLVGFCRTTPHSGELCRLARLGRGLPADPIAPAPAKRSFATEPLELRIARLGGCKSFGIQTCRGGHAPCSFWAAYNFCGMNTC